MKVLAVIGTRPDAIKMAPLIKRLQKSKSIELTVISTGQHTDLLDSVLSEFDIQPDISFQLKRDKSGLNFLVSELSKNFDEHLPQLKPDVVLGHGDTASCFSAALSCFHQGIKFFHIEAGLRSFDLTSPYPEEFYRQSISKMTHTHFCPDQEAKENLLREGVEVENIVVSGNTIVESLSFALSRQYEVDIEGKFVLMTIHRREKTERDFLALQEIMRRHPEKKFVFIEHPNPELKVKTERFLHSLPNVCFLPPQSYFSCAKLIKAAQLVFTDSGGIQEEASLLQKPLIVFRSKTERELQNSNSLLSTDVELIDLRIEQFYSLAIDQRENFTHNFVASTLVESVLLRAI